MEDENFGGTLRRLRISRNLSQFQLGKLIGVSDKAISKWENGYTKPKATSILKLSEVLSVSAEELLKKL